MPEAPQTKPAVPADDALDELPALDGGDGGEEVDAEPDELDDLEDGGSPLDDATAEGDPIDTSEIDATGGESGWLVDADDAEGLDVGTSDLAMFEEAGTRDPRLDFEEPGVGDEDFGLLAEDAAGGLDAGEEGPSAADEDLREQDLPPLDADAEGDVDDAQLIDAGFAPEPVAIPWAAQAWSPVGAPLDVGPVRAIACAGRGVVAATARGLVRVDLEGACEPLTATGIGAPIVRLAAAGDAIAAIAVTGELLVSRDAGATFRSSWRDRASITAGGAGDVTFADGALWMLTRTGALLRSGDLGVAWEAVQVDGRVVAIAVDERGGLSALAVDAEAERAYVRRGVGHADATSTEVPVVIGATASFVAARAAHVAHSAADGGVLRDGVLASRVAGAVAVVFLDDAGTLLVASYRDAEDTTTLVRVTPEGDAEIVADVSGAGWETAQVAAAAEGDEADGGGGADGRLRAIARDDAHGVIWVGGGFGLLALEPRRALPS